MRTTILRRVFIEGNATLAEISRVALVLTLPLFGIVVIYLLNHPGI